MLSIFPSTCIGCISVPCFSYDPGKVTGVMWSSELHGELCGSKGESLHEKDSNGLAWYELKDRKGSSLSLMSWTEKRRQI